MPFCWISEFIHAKRSWILYYRGWIISILNKKRHGIFVLLHATNAKQDLGKKRLRKLSKVWSKHKFFFVKTELQHIQRQLLVNHFILFMLIFFSEIINPWKYQYNSNFPNIKLTTYLRLTRDQARIHDLQL